MGKALKEQEASVPSSEGRGEGRHKKSGSGKNNGSSRIRWLVTIFFLALTISAVFSFLSQELLTLASLLGAFVVLLARKTKEIINQNIIIAFLTSFVMIFLAAMGLISPIAGAFLHNAGAFIVLFNSARVVRAEWEKEAEEKQPSSKITT